jgi:hypothetical protein
MPTWYRLRARESDTHIERVSILSCAGDAASSPRQWASDYYGDEGATWFQATGAGRYLVGRLYDDGYREPGTWVISGDVVDEPNKRPGNRAIANQVER